jgi:bacterioferritin
VTVYLFRLLIVTVINKYSVPGIVKDVSEMLKNDLDIEYKTVKHLLEIIAICEEEKDFETRKILEVLIDDTEMDHATGSNSSWA